MVPLELLEHSPSLHRLAYRGPQKKPVHVLFSASVSLPVEVNILGQDGGRADQAGGQRCKGVVIPPHGEYLHDRYSGGFSLVSTIALQYSHCRIFKYPRK